MRRGALRGATAFALLCAAILTLAGAAAAAPLAQPPGVEGCIVQGGEDGCATGRAMESAIGTPAISPDGRNVYLVSYDSRAGVREAGTIDVLDRDPATGALTQPPGAAGCISGGGREGCAREADLGEVQEIAISPDGRNLYALTDRAVVAFDRDPGTGALTRIPGHAGCVAEPPFAERCAPDPDLVVPADLVVSPDGAEVYITNFNAPTVVTLRRDPITGALSQTGGVVHHVCPPRACGGAEFRHGTDQLALAADGRSVYVVTKGGVESIQILTRTPAGVLRRRGGRFGCVSAAGRGGCRPGRGLRDQVSGVALSPDGHSVYVTSRPRPGSGVGGAISTFSRAGNGALQHPGGSAACTTANGGECRKERSLGLPTEPAVSPDGTSVYVATVFGLTVLAREPSGVLAPLPGPAGCISAIRPGCTKSRLEATEGFAISPDGTDLYVDNLVPGGISVFAR